MSIVKKYSNYLIYQLLESIMITSDEFKSIIKNMPSDNEISDILYTIINSKEDIKTSYNLVDVSPDKNDEVQFLPDNQYQRFITKGDDLSSKSKSKAKIGRMVGQILRDNGHKFVDSDIEKFVNSFKSSWDKKHGISNRKIEVVRGNDILMWYSEDKYHSNEGTLGNSCMRYNKVNHFMKIYSENPDKVSMIILTEDDKLIGRALFWNLDECESNSKNKFYIDRIYTEKDSDVDFIWNWAFENLVKKDINLLASHKNGGNSGLIVNLNKTSFDRYPYADTLNFLYEEVNSDGKLSGSGYLSDQNMYKHRKITEKYVISEIRNHNIGIKSIQTHQYSKSLDIYIISDDAIRIDSDWYPKSMGNYCKFRDEWMFVDDLVWSEAMKDWIPKSQAINNKKYGLILGDALYEIVTGFIRKYKSPLDAFNSIKNNSEEECIVDDLLPSITKYSLPDIRIGDYRYYLTELLKKDIWDDYQISETLVEIYNAGNFSSIRSKYTDIPIIERYGDAYITKDDAIIYGITIGTEPSYISIKNYISKFENIDYSKLMIQISNLDKDTQEKVIGFKEEINVFLLSNSSDYKINQEIFTKLKDQKVIEMYNDVHNISWNRMIDNNHNRFISILKARFSRYGIVLTEEQIVNLTKMMYVFIYFYLNSSSDARRRLENWISVNGYKDKFGLHPSNFGNYDIDSIIEMLRYAYREDDIDDIYLQERYSALEILAKKYGTSKSAISKFINESVVDVFNLDIENVKII